MKAAYCKAPPARDSGFTLVEILVSTAISAAVLLGVFALMGGSLTLFGRTRNAIEQSAQVRFAFERLSADLTGIVTEEGSIQFVENAPTLYNGAPGFVESDRNESLFVVTPSLNSGPGDLCVAAYRLNRETLTLERAFVDSLSAWQTSPRYLAIGHPALEWTPVVEDAIAFEIDCYADEEAKVHPIAAPPLNSTWDSESEGPPAIAILRISLIDHPTATRVKEDGGLGSSTVDLPNPAIFTRKISLRPNSPE